MDDYTQGVEVAETTEAESGGGGPTISDETWAVASSRWINDHVRNSPIAQSTEAWNHLGIVINHLRVILEEELKRSR